MSTLGVCLSIYVGFILLFMAVSMLSSKARDVIDDIVDFEELGLFLLLWPVNLFIMVYMWAYTVITEHDRVVRLNARLHKWYKRYQR